MCMNIVYRFDSSALLCFRQIRDPDGIPPIFIPANFFPARLSEAESRQLPFSSPVFPFTHRPFPVSQNIRRRRLVT